MYRWPESGVDILLFVGGAENRAGHTDAGFNYPGLASPGPPRQIDFPIGGLVSGCRPVIGWRVDCGAVIGGAFSGQAGYSITRHSQGDSGLTIGARNSEYKPIQLYTD